MRKLLIVFLPVTMLFLFPQNVSSRENYIKFCEEIGEMYNISPELLQSLIEREPNYNPNDVSKAGAVGLCQIIPKYQTERMEKLGVLDLFDPYSNILVCADILSEFRDKYYGDLYLVLMCYNEGEYGKAKEKHERGEFSSYAVGIVERAAELETINGK